jgi:hypothetical protein
MGLFGWLEKKEVPADIAMVYREVKESRRREEALRQVVVKQAKEIAQLQRDVRAMRHCDDLLKPPPGDKRSIFQYIFGK